LRVQGVLSTLRQPMCFHARAGARGVVKPALAAYAILGYSWFGILLGAAGVRAQSSGPFFEAQALPRTGYELRVSLGYHAARRDQFAEPVFLFAQFPLQIKARELRAELDLRMALTPALAVQLVVPLAARWVEASFDGLQVSSDEQLPAQSRELSSAGMADPTIALAYRFLRWQGWAAHADLGARLASDDNPGAFTFPTRPPLSTGQNLLYAGIGGSVRLGRLDISAAYRFEYSPGNAATYLVRRISPQSYTSGALASRIGNAVQAEAAYAITEHWSLRLLPEWTSTEFPELQTNAGAVVWSATTWLHVLVIGVEVRWQFAAAHTLALGYRHDVISEHPDDPFFPIQIPSRGVGLSWHVAGY
jgi:hypothetical protein